MERKDTTKQVVHKGYYNHNKSHGRTVDTSISKWSSSNAKGPKATRGNNTIRQNWCTSPLGGYSIQGTSKLHVNRGGRVNQVTRKANEMASQPQHVAKKARPWRV
ncbi:hypothetical protein DVH24_030242 [Malus domestica]|uniref:Uncharacterized protein n=1 Tax=Malus domestica TaxID=3750 RepID=A0A498I261_MALDO|nr:hypothetical protein DVH24_030242 [Malus domestica]